MDHRPPVYEEYQVGKYYDVPCVRVGDVAPKCARLGGWIPVLLPFHEDAAILNFPTEHYHYDLRFIEAKLYREFYFGVVLTQRLVWSDNTFFSGDIVYRRLKCKRRMPVLSLSMLSNHTLATRFEAAYAHARLRNGVCPHKGIDLKQCQVVMGVVTCPGHGLQWDVKTGQLRRQFSENKE